MARAGDRSARLTQEHRAGILRAVERASNEVGAAWQRVVLFGSRVDPSRKGGDIDLLIELAANTDSDVYRLGQRLRLALEDELGEQKVDILIDDGRRQQTMVDIARAQGIELWIND
jgi:predicted nucleotidyltransferase